MCTPTYPNLSSTVESTRKQHLQHFENKKNEQLEDDADSETNERDNTNGDDNDGIQHAYEKIYHLTKEEQLECQKKERGVRRHCYEGKACLERYRIASMRIFSVVLESLRERLGDKSGKDRRFVLERASIDEFYLDITNYCYSNECNDISMAETTCKNDNTVVVGCDVIAGANIENENDWIQQEAAFQRACRVSRWIRQDVWETLGFTMSAGISTNKMMAKLAASYGKPNGQEIGRAHV